MREQCAWASRPPSHGIDPVEPTCSQDRPPLLQTRSPDKTNRKSRAAPRNGGAGSRSAIQTQTPGSASDPGALRDDCSSAPLDVSRQRPQSLFTAPNPAQRPLSGGIGVSVSP